MSDGHDGIAPPMRSAGVVAIESFLMERRLETMADRDALACAIYRAMEDENPCAKARVESRRQMAKSFNELCASQDNWS